METSIGGIPGGTIVIKALEDGVCVISFSGGESAFHQMEKLNCGEVYFAQLSNQTQALKVSGKARVYSSYGVVDAGE